MPAGLALAIDFDALRREYQGAPDEAVFLERAHLLRDAMARHSGLAPGRRQGRILEDVCLGIPIVVREFDVFLGRLREDVPGAQDEAFIEANPQFFITPGVPGHLDSAGIYCPGWGRLLARGIGGLLADVEAAIGSCDDKRRRDWLEGVRTSLSAASALAHRYAEEARRAAASVTDAPARTRLLDTAEACETIAIGVPRTLREALQLQLLFHVILSCIVGARNVTPGRMDQYLLPFYRRDIETGVIDRGDAARLIAAAFVMLSQGSGSISTDFQSTKRSPSRYSHYYVTLAGRGEDGRCAANELSGVIIEAQRIADVREPSLLVRYTPDIDRAFWRQALSNMREGRAVLVFNDDVVMEGLARSGVDEDVARDYVQAGCVNCLLSGRGTPTLRDNLNLSAAIVAVMNAKPAETAALRDFDAFLEALRTRLRTELSDYAAGLGKVNARIPLVAWPLYEAHLTAGREYWEQVDKRLDLHVTGIATAVDSLLGISRIVYDERLMTLAELAAILAANYQGHEVLRARLSRAPSYGQDEPEVLEMTRRLGALWCDEVERAPAGPNGMRLRPGFHSWLFNLEAGRATGATPDGRRAREPLSNDLLPSAGRGRTPTAILRCIAALPHARTCSGGTTFTLDGTHFEGDEGLERLAALIEGYFAEGGMQIHVNFCDRATLVDAVEHPERHAGLLVRVTGFSEYFVRLLSEVQQDVIRRAAR